MGALVGGVLEGVAGDNWGERGEGSTAKEEEEEGKELREIPSTQTLPLSPPPPPPPDVPPVPSVLLSCLQLCVAGVCVRLLGPSFLPHLQTMAFLLLQKAGSPSPEVASQALATLHTVTACSGFR